MPLVHRIASRCKCSHTAMVPSAKAAQLVASTATKALNPGRLPQQTVLSVSFWVCSVSFTPFPSPAQPAQWKHILTALKLKWIINLKRTFIFILPMACLVFLRMLKTRAETGASDLGRTWNGVASVRYNPWASSRVAASSSCQQARTNGAVQCGLREESLRKRQKLARLKRVLMEVRSWKGALAALDTVSVAIPVAHVLHSL